MTQACTIESEKASRQLVIDGQWGYRGSAGWLMMCDLLCGSWSRIVADERRLRDAMVSRALPGMEQIGTKFWRHRVGPEQCNCGTLHGARCW